MLLRGVCVMGLVCVLHTRWQEDRRLTLNLNLTRWQEDRRPFPLHRRLPTDTPPIPGYSTEEIGGEDTRE